MSVPRRVVAAPAGQRSRWLFLVLWGVLAVVAVPLAGQLQGAQTNDDAAFLPANAESTRVLEIQHDLTGTDTVPAVVVYERTGGLTAQDRIRVARVRAEVRDAGLGPGELPPPVPSADGEAIQLVVPIRTGEGPELADAVTTLRKVAGDVPEGLDVHVTGPAGVQADFLEVFADIDGTLLVATLVVVVLVLLVTYRSPVLWIFPVVAAGVSLQAAQAANYLLAAHAGLTVNGQSAGILLVLVFGAGTDYALLLVARYREELRRHKSRFDAMAIALRRSWPAVFASMVTVVLGVLCLLVSELSSTRGLGPVAAVGIVFAFLAMTTLLPALLVLAGRWIFWPLVPRYGSEPHEHGSIWARIGGSLDRRPRLTWVGTTLALGVLALGLVRLDATGLSNESSFVNRPESVTGQQVLERHYASAVGNPLVVVGPANAAAQMRRALQATDGVASVGRPTIARGSAVVEAQLLDAADSAGAYDTVRRARAAVDGLPGDVLVGGTSAISLDVQESARRDSRVVIPLVLAVVLVVLALLLRSLLAPVLLVATVVLSFAAALGASAVVFESVFGFTGADSSFPLFAFIFLVALGIDYNIFLMTRVREESSSLGTRMGTLQGLAVTGGVITSAGVVLAATFSVLGVLPLVPLAQIGFAVAFGVLLDTLVVRSLLVPALALDLGRHIWWPGRLAREHGRGEALETEPAEVSP